MIDPYTEAPESLFLSVALRAAPSAALAGMSRMGNSEGPGMSYNKGVGGPESFLLANITANSQQ